VSHSCDIGSSHDGIISNMTTADGTPAHGGFAFFGRNQETQTAISSDTPANQPLPLQDPVPSTDSSSSRLRHSAPFDLAQGVVSLSNHDFGVAGSPDPFIVSSRLSYTAGLIHWRIHAASE